MFGCESEVIGQEKACVRCGYIWDLNDPEPPTCKTKNELSVERNNRHLAKIRKDLKR